MTVPTLVSLADLRAAAAVIEGVAVRTPLLPAPGLGKDIWIKPEMLQRSGSFKFRGAYAYVACLSSEQRARGVITPSSGNHAQAVALAAQMFGVPAVVVMPLTVTPAKRAGAERLGARVELCGFTTRDRMERARAIAAAEGLSLVPPYDDPHIIAAQGTAGLEIVEDLPEVKTVIVPVGGGGLSAGVAVAVKRLRPETRVVGVEPVGAPKLTRARQAGAPVELERTASLADGLLAVRVGTLNFAHHQAFIDEVVTVDDAALTRAMRVLLDRCKVVAEPSGAITVAALLEGLVEPAGPTVALVSGGNIEWPELAHLLGS